MKNKINIAELLKDCPKGMELYSPIFGEVYLDKIRPHLAIVVTTNKEQDDFKEEFLYDGRYGMNGECMLFPSKDKTTWEGFAPPCKFRDGDILFVKSAYDWISIYKESENDEKLYIYLAIQNSSYHTYILYDDYPLCCKEDISEIRIATEEEKQKLFDAIKAKGYKWNPDIKTLEKLVEPRFKVGDRIQGYGTHINYPIRVVKSLEWDRYRLDNGNYIKFGDEHAYKLLKFDITTLVPFESKVLVRDINSGYWIGAFYSHYNSKKFYTIGGSRYYQCIPYEGNEHLLGTTNDCDDFYKTW